MRHFRRDLPENAWIRQLKPGDVVESNTGLLRIVRTVRISRHRYAWLGYGPRVTVTFIIKHCSWTHRCYTTVSDSDLITNGYRPIGVQVELDTEFDENILREIERHDLPLMSCCDVEGIA